MPDFGQYQGHQILANAMNNSLNRAVQISENKAREKRENAAMAQRKYEYTTSMNQRRKEFQENLDQRRTEFDRNDLLKSIELDDRLKTTGLNRDVTEFNYNQLLDAHNKDKLKKRLETDLYSDIGKVSPLIKTADGGLVVNPEYESIMSDWENKHDYGSIMEHARGLSGEYGGATLSLDDISSIANNPDYGKHNFVQLKKLFSGYSEDQINDFMDANPGFSDMMMKYGIDQAAPKGQDESWGEYFSPSEGEDLSITDMELMGGKGWTGEWSTEVPVRSGWGGDIQFKSTIAPSKKSMKRQQILIDAVKEMKDNETGVDVSDDVFIEYGNGGWTISEDDTFGNDTYEVKWKGNTPYIEYNGSPMAINTLTNFWE